MAPGTAQLRQASAPAGRINLKTVEEAQRSGAQALKERLQRTAADTDSLKQIREQWQEAVEAKDFDKLSVLNATLKTASEKAAANRGDLATMMSRLLENYKDMGIAIKAAQEFDENEKRMIDTAQGLVDSAKLELQHAQARKINIFGSRNRAIDAANAAIKTAEMALETAKAEAEASKRARLNNMSLAQSTQLQQSIAQELTDVAQNRVATIDQDLADIQTNVDATEDQIKADTDEFESLDKKLAQAKAELGTLQEELSSYQPNSSDWQDCRRRINLKTREHDELETQRNSALLRSQEGQKFLEFNKGMEEGQRTLLAQTKLWISIMQMGSEQRNILYQQQMRFSQGVADHEALEPIDQIASATDIRLHEETAEKSAALRRKTLDRLARMPKELAAMRDVNAATVEDVVNYEKRISSMIDEFHKNFGTPAGFDSRDTYRDAPQPAH